MPLCHDEKLILMLVLANKGWDHKVLDMKLPDHSRRTKQRTWKKIKNTDLPDEVISTYDVLRGILHVDPPPLKMVQTTPVVRKKK